MALRSLARGTWAPAACALRCPSGAGTPPAAAAAAAPSRFLSTVRKQNDIAIPRLSYDVEYAQDLLKRAKKQEEDMRRGIKWFSRGAKAVEWACYLCVSVTVATAVRVGKP